MGKLEAESFFRESKRLREESKNDWREWLSNDSFYVYGCVYLSARVAISVSMGMLPFYLI